MGDPAEPHRALYPVKGHRRSAQVLAAACAALLSVGAAPAGLHVPPADVTLRLPHLHDPGGLLSAPRAARPTQPG